MNKIHIHPQYFLFIILLFFVQKNTYAGLFNMRSEMTYDIQVIDEQGMPISGAALWSKSITERDQNHDWTKVMERLFDRYFIDYDYARPLGLMSSRMVIHYVNADGQFHWLWQTHRKPPMLFAVLKRGYFPDVVIVQPKLNRKQTLVFKLKKNPADIVDPRMEEFDRLRGDVFSSRNIGLTEAERYDYIQSRISRITQLAQEMEADNPELAARLYINLADLPRVDIFYREDGSIAGGGFSNGYDSKNPERLQYFEKGLSLDSRTPAILARRITHRENQTQLLSEPEPLKSGKMRLGLEQTVEIAESYPERIWPNTYIWLIYRHNSLNDFKNACQALQEAYNFEPATLDMKNWLEIKDDIDRNAIKHGQPKCNFSFDE